MHEDFEIAYEKYLDKFNATITDEQRTAYRRYALGNRQRGEDAVLALPTLIGRDVDGMNCLDVGSGYGGLLLALASEGATVMGIEYAKELHDLSLINIAGEPHSIPIYLGNFLDRDVLPEGEKFDLIIINDVFEHIHDIDYLFRRLQEVSHDETIIYFEIPNHRSYHAIRKEHHKFVFGLALLEPGSWAEVTGPFNIYHRPLSLYSLLFKSIGYDTLTLNTAVSVATGTAQRIRVAHEEIDREIEVVSFKTEQLRAQVRSNFDRLRLYFEEDAARCSESKLFSEYEAYAWTGCATKRGTRPSDRFVCFDL
jgi:2-polyprenyl-3-methyl-5-hydroxy-6-metoxy-1,4-benzoquinol methylase